MNTQIKEQENNPHDLITTPSIVTTDIREVLLSKKSQPVLYKLSDFDNFEDVFNIFLDRKEQEDIRIQKIYTDRVIPSFTDDLNPINTRRKTCFIKQVYKIFMKALNNPKYDDKDRFIGYSIPTDGKLNALIKNPLYKHFNFFVRAENSTYHTNSAKYGKSNAYCHWYYFSEELIRIRRGASRRLYFAIKRVRNRLDNVPNQDIKKYKRAPKGFVFDPVNYCRIELKPFLMELYMFKCLGSDAFATVVSHAKFIDKKYVYVDNTCKKKAESGTTLERHYSCVSLMKKEMRERLFAGFLEVDLDCANQTLMLNLICLNTKAEMKNIIPFPELKKMLDNKYIYRTGISWDFRLKSIATAKKLIQQIAQAPKTRIIYKYLVRGVEKPSPELIALATEKIKPLVDDCLKLQKMVLKIFYEQSVSNYDYSYKIGSLTLSDIPKIVDEEIRLKNKTLKGHGKGKDLDSRRYYHIYCLIEHQVRNCMIDYVQRKHACHGGVDVYQVHDAILCNNRKLTGNNELIKHVKECLGFDIKLSHKYLGAEAEK